MAKDLAKAGAEKELHDEPNLEINPNVNLSGAQLLNMTQALAYRGICEIKKMYRERSRTAQTIAITWHAAQKLSSKYPDEAAVWGSTRHRDFSKSYRTFM